MPGSMMLKLGVVAALAATVAGEGEMPPCAATCPDDPPTSCYSFAQKGCCAVSCDDNTWDDFMSNCPEGCTGGPCFEGKAYCPGYVAPDDDDAGEGEMPPCAATCPEDPPDTCDGFAAAACCAVSCADHIWDHFMSTCPDGCEIGVCGSKEKASCAVGDDDDEGPPPCVATCPDDPPTSCDGFAAVACCASTCADDLWAQMMSTCPDGCEIGVCGSKEKASCPVAKTCANSGDNDDQYTCAGDFEYDPDTADVVCPQPDGCKEHVCCKLKADGKTTTADASTAVASFAAMLASAFAFFGSN